MLIMKMFMFNIIQRPRATIIRIITKIMLMMRDHTRISIPVIVTVRPWENSGKGAIQVVDTPCYDYIIVGRHHSIGEYHDPANT